MLSNAWRMSPYQFIRIIPTWVRSPACADQILKALATERPVALPLREGRTMFTAQQYRAKAARYDGLLASAQSPAEAAEYRDFKQSYTSHADNLDWLAANAGKP